MPVRKNVRLPAVPARFGRKHGPWGAARGERACPGRQQYRSVIGLSPAAAGAPVPDAARTPASEVSPARSVCHCDSCPARCGRRSGRPPSIRAGTSRVMPMAVTCSPWPPGPWPVPPGARTRDGHRALPVAWPAGQRRITAQILKEGRRFATGTATMVSGSRPLLAVLGTLGDLSQAQGPELVEGAPPELPPPEQCVRLHPTGTFPPPFMGRVDLRLHPDDAAFATGHQSGRALMRGWFRLPGAEPLDSLALLCAVDAFPPTAFNARLPVAWTPTVSSPLTSGPTRRPAGSAAAFRPDSSPPVSSRRTAKSGIAPGAWSASRVSSPSSPGTKTHPSPPARSCKTDSPALPRLTNKPESDSSTVTSNENR